MPAGISEKFLAINDRVPDGYQLEYRPACWAKAKCISFARPTASTCGAMCFVLQSIQSTPPDDIWEGASINPQSPSDRRSARCTRPVRRTAGGIGSRDKSYTVFARQLKDHLYREASLKL